MKTQISAFELKYLVEELQQLVEGRINQIYQPKGLYFQIHKTNTGKFLLRVEPNAAWLTKEKPAMPQKQPGLCQALRKYIKGKKITAIKQLGSERIIQVTLETQQETYLLFIEFFAQGNVILTDGKHTIIRALEQRAWKDRTIKPHETYVLPPQKHNIFKLTREDFVSHDNEKDLAILGFGKLYARELTAIAANPTPDSLHAAYQELISKPPTPSVYDDGEITPIQLIQREGKPYNTFSEAIDDNWGEEIIVKKKETRLDKMQKQIEMQQKTVQDLEEKAQIAQRKGELIYEHYEKVKETLEKAKGPKKITIDLP